jgi:hypothetical protein
MKKIYSLTVFFIAAAVALFATSCRELAQNGDFSGQWQILSIEYPDGTTIDPEGTRYYCIYRDVAQLTAPGGTRVTGNLSYDEDAGTFSIQFPGNSPSYLKDWGITFPDDISDEQQELTARFTINDLTSKRLVMTTDMGVVITCRKF